MIPYIFVVWRFFVLYFLWFDTFFASRGSHIGTKIYGPWLPFDHNEVTNIFVNFIRNVYCMRGWNRIKTKLLHFFIIMIISVWVLTWCQRTIKFVSLNHVNIFVILLDITPFIVSIKIEWLIFGLIVYKSFFMYITIVSLMFSSIINPILIYKVILGINIFDSVFIINYVGTWFEETVYTTHSASGIELTLATMTFCLCSVENFNDVICLWKQVWQCPLIYKRNSDTWEIISAF